MAILFSVSTRGIICSNGYVVNLASFPGLPPVFPFFCVQNNTREWKTSENQGRPGSIHHVSGCKLDVREEGSRCTYYT